MDIYCIHFHLFQGSMNQVSCHIIHSFVLNFITFYIMAISTITRIIKNNKFYEEVGIDYIYKK